MATQKFTLTRRYTKLKELFQLLDYHFPGNYSVEVSQAVPPLYIFVIKYAEAKQMRNDWIVIVAPRELTIDEMASVSTSE